MCVPIAAPVMLSRFAGNTGPGDSPACCSVIPGPWSRGNPFDLPPDGPAATGRSIRRRDDEQGRHHVAYRCHASPAFDWSPGCLQVSAAIAVMTDDMDGNPSERGAGDSRSRGRLLGHSCRACPRAVSSWTRADSRAMSSRCVISRASSSSRLARVMSSRPARTSSIWA